MTGPIEKALLCFVRATRSRRHALAVLVLLGWVLVAESLLVVHRIDHTSTGHGVSCALCLAADHHAATLDEPAEVVVPAGADPVVALVAESVTAVAFVPYQSRAPPPNLRIRL